MMSARPTIPDDPITASELAADALAQVARAQLSVEENTLGELAAYGAAVENISRSLHAITFTLVVQLRQLDRGREPRRPDPPSPVRASGRR